MSRRAAWCFVVIGLASWCVSPATVLAATLVFDSDFEGETTGLSQTDLVDWFVLPDTPAANVDIVSTVFCAGGGGKCVDNDGSQSPAAATIETKTSFNLKVGEVYTVGFFVDVRSPDPTDVKLGSEPAQAVTLVDGSYVHTFAITVANPAGRLSFINNDTTPDTSEGAGVRRTSQPATAKSGRRSPPPRSGLVQRAFSDARPTCSS